MSEPMTPKIARLKLVANGLRRIQEFESARYLDEYAVHLAQPAQAVDVGTDFGAMNDALCAFAMRWEIDGDYLRCLKCKRPQITNYASHDFPHAHGCKAVGKVEARPWETFARLLLPLTRALSGEKAGPVGDDTSRIDWMASLGNQLSGMGANMRCHWIHLQGHKPFCGQTLREAIDAAREVVPTSPAPDKEGL